MGDGGRTGTERWSSSAGGHAVYTYIHSDRAHGRAAAEPDPGPRLAEMHGRRWTAVAASASDGGGVGERRCRPRHALATHRWSCSLSSRPSRGAAMGAAPRPRRADHIGGSALSSISHQWTEHARLSTLSSWCHRSTAWPAMGLLWSMGLLSPGARPATLDWASRSAATCEGRGGMESKAKSSMSSSEAGRGGAQSRAARAELKIFIARRALAACAEARGARQTRAERTSDEPWGPSAAMDDQRDARAACHGVTEAQS